MSDCKNCEGMLVFKFDDFQSIVNIAHDKGVERQNTKIQELIDKWQIKSKEMLSIYDEETFSSRGYVLKFINDLKQLIGDKDE